MTNDTLKPVAFCCCKADDLAVQKRLKSARKENAASQPAGFVQPENSKTLGDVAKARALNVFRSLANNIKFFGFGRWDGLSALSRRHLDQAQTPLLRFVSLVTGALLIGIAVALLSRASLGLTPYDVFASSIAGRTPLTLGQSAMGISAVMFMIAAILGRPATGWALLYVFLTGTAVDLVSAWVNTPDQIWARWLFVAGAILFLSFGISLVVHSGRTGGSFELLMLAGEDRGLSQTKTRVSLEVTILVIGIALGGDIGPATMVMAFATGPSLALMNQVFTDFSRGREIRMQIETLAKADPTIAKADFKTQAEKTLPAHLARRVSK